MFNVECTEVFDFQVEMCRTLWPRNHPCKAMLVSFFFSKYKLKFKHKWCHFSIFKAYILEYERKVIRDNHDKLSQKTKLKDQALLKGGKVFVTNIG